MKIVSCKTNHIENPLGFHMDEAVVSWIAKDSSSKKQKAAQVIVAADSEMKEVVYDSGMDESLDSRAVALPIKLEATTRYYWTVKVEGDAGDTATSGVNWFETAKMDKPWQAKWLSSPWPQEDDNCKHPYVKKEFNNAKSITKARIYITGMGVYELFINDKRVGDECLAPYCNTYDAWVQYQTYDVTDSITSGKNELGVMLANGWSKGRFGTFGEHNTPYTKRFSLICELHISYKDGTSEVIGTDNSWLCKPSPVIFDSIYDGVIYDANLESIDEWEAMQEIEAPQELGRLMARLSLPVKVMEEIKPIALLTTPAGETVLDMGQNMVGWLKMRVSAPKGTKITISHGEILQHGNFYRDNLRSAKAEYIYISDGTEKVIEPRFSFYGFRFAKIEGIDNVKLEDFTGCVLYSELETVGKITTSDERVNRLFENVIWGQKGNFLDVPTDCPQRDERMGWTGDTQIFASTAMFNMRSYAFYVKFMYDLYEEQKLCEGMVPAVVPQFAKTRYLDGSFMGGGACAWADCATVVPWEVYLHSGDKTILKNQFQSMKDWVDWVTRKCEKDNTGLLWIKGFQYGDWLALDGPDPKSAFGGTDTGYLASAYYKLSSQITAKTAAILGYDQDAKKYADLSENIKKAIQEKYFNPDGSCKITTQTAQVVALHFELATNRQRILAELNKLLEENNMHLTTGFIGTPYLCRTLSDNGSSENAYRLFLNDDYPSWLYPVGMGATTIWERWNSVLPDGLLSDTGMNSLNHYAYGSIADWMYRNMCGINNVEAAPGFKEILLKPEPNKSFKFAKAEVDTAMGLVKCGWEYGSDGTLTVKAEVPFNTEAVLQLPRAGEEPRRLEAGSYSFHLA